MLEKTVRGLRLPAAAGIAALVLSLTAAPVYAQKVHVLSNPPVTSPPAAGNAFRILALTRATRGGSDVAGSIYDTFVRAQIAATGLAAIRPYAADFVAWISDGSTSGQSGRTRTGTGGTGLPVYWLNSTQVAPNYQTLYTRAAIRAIPQAPTFEDGTAAIAGASTRLFWTKMDYNGDYKEGLVNGGVQLERYGQVRSSGLEIRPGSDNPNTRSYSVAAMSPIFIVANPNLPISVTDFTGGDDVIDAEDRAAGFTISGDLGPAGAGATVQVSFDGVSAAAVTASNDQMATAGEWSFTVPANAAYVPVGSGPLTVDIAVSVAGLSLTESLTLSLATATGPTSEQMADVTETVLSEVGVVAAVQAVDVIGARLGAPGADSAGQGFSLQVGAARLESALRDQERAEQMSGWASLASQDDFDRAMLGRSSFSLSSGGAGAAWTLWGKGAYREYDHEDRDVETDGDTLSGFVGLDFDRGRLRHGLAVGRTWGDGTYRSGEHKGEHELDLTSGYYYLRGRTSFGSLWGMLGAGTGDVKIDGDNSDLTMQMAAAGAEVKLPKQADFDLAARAEGMATWLDAEGNPADSVLGVSVGAQRLRAALEASKEIDFKSGAWARPSAEAGVRYDGGDGAEGAGLELGGGMTFSSGRLTTEMHATWLAVHREDLEEWGASVSARYGIHGNAQHGLWLGAEAAGGLERGALGLDPAGDPGAWLRDSEETDGDAAGSLFSAEAGYGIGTRNLGLMTPFVGFSSDSSARRTFSQGLRLRLNSRVDAELAGTQSHGGGADDDHSYGIEIKAHF